MILYIFWLEGLDRDRSASRRVARMDIITSTCTTEMSICNWLTLAQTTSESHQYNNIFNHHTEEQGPTTDENKRQNDIHPCYPRLPPRTHPRLMMKKKKNS